MCGCKSITYSYRIRWVDARKLWNIGFNSVELGWILVFNYCRTSILISFTFDDVHILVVFSLWCQFFWLNLVDCSPENFNFYSVEMCAIGVNFFLFGSTCTVSRAFLCWLIFFVELVINVVYLSRKVFNGDFGFMGM